MPVHNLRTSVAPIIFERFEWRPYGSQCFFGLVPEKDVTLQTQRDTIDDSALAISQFSRSIRRVIAADTHNLQMEAHRHALRRTLARRMLKKQLPNVSMIKSRSFADYSFRRQSYSYFFRQIDPHSNAWLDCRNTCTVVETDNRSMTDNYIIETSHGAVGLVVRSGRGFMFFSAKREFDGMEGRLFTSPARAVKAAIVHETKRGTRFTTRRRPR